MEKYLTEDYWDEDEEPLGFDSVKDGQLWLIAQLSAQVCSRAIIHSSDGDPGAAFALGAGRRTGRGEAAAGGEHHVRNDDTYPEPSFNHRAGILPVGLPPSHMSGAQIAGASFVSTSGR